jgi:hypothetical protein
LYAFLMTFLLVIFGASIPASATQDNALEIETEGSYRMAPGSSVGLVKSIALFNAEIKAVELAGRYLSHDFLVETYKLDKDEIYCLVTREIRPEILMEKWERIQTQSIYKVRIRTRVKASDFIKAEMQDKASAKKEANPPYQEELGQPVSDKVDLGKDIAKAYRLLRRREWRMAAIYLNHLEKKYPNWDRIYMAKAITHYFCHDLVSMRKVLSKACSLGHPIACEDLTNLKKVHEQDFGLSIFD